MNTIRETTEPESPTGLPAPAIESIRQVFRLHPAVEAVTLYGSRATGGWRNASDIDLSIVGAGITWDEFHHIETELDDLLLPWKIDLALQHHIDNPALLNAIHQKGLKLYP